MNSIIVATEPLLVLFVKSNIMVVWLQCRWQSKQICSIAAKNTKCTAMSWRMHLEASSLLLLDLANLRQVMALIVAKCKTHACRIFLWCQYACCSFVCLEFWVVVFMHQHFIERVEHGIRRSEFNIWMPDNARRRIDQIDDETFQESGKKQSAAFCHQSITIKVRFQWLRP